MRILILNHYYYEFTAAWFQSHPGLSSASYAEQRESFGASLFGGTTFEVAGLRQLGHEADVSIVNVRTSQEAWAREHGVHLTPERPWHVRFRRGWLPWPARAADARWVGEAALAQIDAFRPDVVHVQCMDSLDPALIPEIRQRTRLVTGQIAAPLPTERALAGYDLVVSSLPNFVERFRKVGVTSEWLPLGFEPAIAALVGPVERTVPISFIGSLFAAHGSRLELLDEVGRSVPLEVWTADDASLSAGSPLRQRLHRPVWGADMYRALAASQITLNTHIDIAERYANNLRLYEGTGMGALLVTDRKVNLGELFEPEREVVTYGDATECAEKVQYYVEHPDEATRIAAAGQARTLRDHTWLDRMDRLSRMMESRL